MDAGVIAAASRGDEGAWGEIVRAYARRIYALAKSRCRDADVAEEITQSVLATVATKLGGGSEGYDERGRFESWLFRVAMNRVRDHVRRSRRRLDRGELGDAEVERASARREGQGDRPGELAELREAIERLSEADRDVIELRHHGGMSFQDMAELLGEPIGTLLARHHRALRKLRELMEAKETSEASAEGKGRVKR